MPWFGELPAEHRAWIGMVLQAGYNSFITGTATPSSPRRRSTVEVFGTAPRSFAGVITLQQTVAMIRLSIEVAEADLSEAVVPGARGRGAREHPALRPRARLRHRRHLRARRGDARRLGRPARGARRRLGHARRRRRDRAHAGPARWAGSRPATSPSSSAGRPSRRRRPARGARRRGPRRGRSDAGLDALGAVQGDRLVVVVGGVSDPDKAGALLTPHFGDGPVVVGPVVAGPAPGPRLGRRGGRRAPRGRRLAGARRPRSPATTCSPSGRSTATRIARRALVADVYVPLRGQRARSVLETLTAFLDQGGSIEGTGRALFVHPNTVRYRLERIPELTGLSPRRRAARLHAPDRGGPRRLGDAPRSPRPSL